MRHEGREKRERIEDEGKELLRKRRKEELGMRTRENGRAQKRS